MKHINQTENQTIVLRPLKREDFPKLVEWINSPHVAKYWDGQTDLEKVVAKYEPTLLSTSKVHVFIANLNDLPIGMIQCYRHAEFPKWDATVAVANAIGIDYLIGDVVFVGKGIGPLIIEEMVKKAFEIYADCDVVVSAPQQHNRASCRALEKAGFVLKEARKLDSDCPSDADISAIYIRAKTN